MASKFLRSSIKAALLAGGLTVATSGVHATGISGPYLAARQAVLSSNYSEAAKYYLKATAARPGNLRLKEAAALALIATGDVERAVRVAKSHADAGGENQIIDLVLTAQKIRDGDFDIETEAGTRTAGIGPLINGLLTGWSLIGQGNMTGAVEAFEAVASIDDFASFAHYHSALAFALVGDLETADGILSGDAHGPLVLSTRGVLAHAQVLVQLERRDDAAELLTAASANGFSPEIDDLLARLDAGEDLSFDIVTSAQDGVAEMFFNLASALANQATPDHVLLYSRLAQHLRPDHTPATLMIAEVLEQQRQFDLAAAAYAEVPRDDPAYYIAEMGRADVLFASDRRDAAAEVLIGLARAEPEIPVVHAALGDMLSRLERDAESIAAYSKSLELRPADQPSSWRVYYARGIVHERQGDFEGMERDFRKALSLSPDHPDVLNYLGYSLVEQRIKLDEALEMIRTAVDKRPESGYITDSLGWVFYRLGRYEEAVAPMERAVELIPIDPIVNDHLGDVYWKVGRYREAEFQWKRALSFDPDEKEAERIRLKLDIGLDRVLEQEAASGETQTAND